MYIVFYRLEKLSSVLQLHNQKSNTTYYDMVVGYEIEAQYGARINQNGESVAQKVIEAFDQTGGGHFKHGFADLRQLKH